jgi:hypothetical protein
MMNGFAEISRVESPRAAIKLDTINPQKDPKIADGQKTRDPTANMHSPVMMVILKPNLVRTKYEKAGGPVKYAIK